MGKGRDKRFEEKKEKFVEKIKKAQAVAYDEKEAQDIVTGKRVQFVQMQVQIRTAYLDVLLKKAEIEEMRTQINDKQVGDLFIKIKWSGMECPIKILKIMHDVKLDAYKEVLAKFNNVQAQLKPFNLSDEQLNEVVNKGKIFDKLPEEQEAKNNEKGKKTVEPSVDKKD